MKNIVLAVVTDEKSKKILFQRRETKDFLEGYWELPGGKVESGETKRDSLLRELKEELTENLYFSLLVTKIQELGSQEFDYTDKNLKLNFTLFHVPSSVELGKEESTDYMWVDAAEIFEETFQKKIPPATADLFSNLRNRLSL